MAVFCLGQAVTSYEVFTGKALPRQSLLRYWRQAVILAGGYAAIVSLSIVFNLHPIYIVVLSALLMTIFFALLSWRSFSERQNFIDQLRPFVTSPRVYDQLLATSPMDVDINQPFSVLCQDVLGTHYAYLAAQGPLAALVEDPLTFPAGQAPRPVNLEGILGPWVSPENICIPLSEGSNPDWRWLVPLWSARGLIGILLLGPKRDGGLYAQEEIEIARTVGERLIDTRASAEMSRRLMALQRQRLVESQVVDRRTRRVLHDEVLPYLHAALLSLNTAGIQNSEAISALSNAHRQIANLLRELPIVTAPDVSRSGLIPALQKTVENEFAGSFAQVDWSVPQNVIDQLKQLSPLASEVVYFAAREVLRNAARHGRVGDSLPNLKISSNPVAQGWELIIEDHNAESREVQQNTTGSGQGLALHSTMMAVIGGELSFEQIPGGVTHVRLRVPSNTQ
jgi:signal transduction histidine kinase